MLSLGFEIFGDFGKHLTITRLEAAFDFDPRTQIRQVEIDQIALCAERFAFVYPLDAALVQFGGEADFKLRAHLNTLINAGSRTDDSACAVCQFLWRIRCEFFSLFSFAYFAL